MGAVAVQAQYAEYMRSGRPGQSIGTYTVGARVLQGQHGFSFRKNDFNPGETRTFASTNVLRLGLTEDFEISGVLRYQTDTRTDLAAGDRSGISSTQLGVRYNITSASSGVPSMCIQTRLLLNVRSDDFKQGGVGNTTIFSIGQGLGAGFGLTGNLGFTTGGSSPQTTSFYTLSLGYNVTPKLSLFVEEYGRIDDFDLNVDAGIGYFVTPDFKLDISAGLQGFGEFEGDPAGLESDYFLSAGLSWRVDWRE